MRTDHGLLRQSQSGPRPGASCTRRETRETPYIDAVSEATKSGTSTSHEGIGVRRHPCRWSVENPDRRKSIGAATQEVERAHEYHRGR
jgi:hypothetical protein